MSLPNTMVVLGIMGLILSPSMRTPAQEALDKVPDVGVFARAGQASLKRLEQQAASWTATTRLGGDTRVLVQVTATPTKRRSVLSIEAQGRRSEVLRIIVRDGIWFATEGRKAGKYRPYEAPFDLPTAYFFLTRSDPQFLANTQGVGLGTYEGTTDGIATYRSPLAEPMRRQLRNLLGEYEELGRRNPQQVTRPEIVRTIERAKDLLRNGNPTRIDVASGLIVQFGGADRQTEIQDFRWEDRVADEEFTVEGTPWEDFTGDPTEGGTSELLMISHSGIWRPGMKSGDTDGRLLDLRTGRSRRIPFRGATVLPGCFLRGRTRVVISGLDALRGVIGLYEVDLRTGENRRLGGDQLASGVVLMPALSPDGQTLAVLHKGASERMLETQVMLVDLKSGEPRPLGEPRDQAFPSWLPDGQGLVLLVREPTDPADPTSIRTKTIVRMDLEGRGTTIREGDMPVLLNDGQTILFQDSTSRTWQTCGLDGGNLKTLADGLADYGFPSPAPDGNRLLMMHFRQGAAPEPTVLRIGESEGKPAVRGPGLWAAPAWR